MIRPSPSRPTPPVLRPAAAPEPPHEPGRGRLLVPLLCVVIAALGIRTANWTILGNGPLFRMHHWAESDMHFFRSWAREIAAGDLLSRRAGRPSHSWHDNFAREVHESTGSSEPYGPEVRRRLWDRWLGGAVFYQDPLYPYMLAGLFALFGGSVLPGLALQAILGIGSALLVWWITLRLYGGAAALIAGLAAALFGPSLLYEILLLRTSTITFLGLATVAAGLLVLTRPERRIWLPVAGCLAGLSILVKSSALIFAGSFLLVTAHRYRADVKDDLRRCALFLAGLALALAPLAARNLAVGVPILATAASGPVTFLNHNAADYAPMAGDTTSAFAAGILHRTDGRLIPAVVETLRTHESIGSWLRLLGGKLLAFVHGYEVPNNASYDYFRLALGPVALLLAGFPLIAPPAAVGLALSAGRSHAHALLAAHAASGVFLTIAFYHLSRFRAPVVMTLLPFAGFAVVRAAQALRARRWKPLLAGLGAAGLVGALVLRPLPPAHPRIRIADHGVANEIAAHLASERAEAGDLAGAMRILEAQLALMPEDLKALSPSEEPSRISRSSALLAASFRPLHERAADLHRRAGEAAEAARHARRAGVLRTVEAQAALSLAPDPEGLR